MVGENYLKGHVLLYAVLALLFLSCKSTPEIPDTSYSSDVGGDYGYSDAESDFEPDDDYYSASEVGLSDKQGGAVETTVKLDQNSNKKSAISTSAGNAEKAVESQNETKSAVLKDKNKPTVANKTAKRKVKKAKKNAKTKRKSSCKYMNADECKVFHLTNRERKKHGLKPFIESKGCSVIADDRSKQFVQVGGQPRSDHVTGRGEKIENTADRLKFAWMYIAENYAGNYSPEVVVKQWMNSPSHRDGILDPKATHLGVGHTKSRVFRGYADRLGYRSEKDNYTAAFVQCFHGPSGKFLSGKRWRNFSRTVRGVASQ